MELANFIFEMKPVKPKVIAVAAAEDDVVLKAVVSAYEHGFCLPILCGNSNKIIQLAQTLDLNISSFEIINTTSTLESAQVAVRLVKEGKADILMKGILQSAELLRAVLDKENGIRSKGVISHVAVVRSPALGRTLFIADAAMVTYPDLKTKVEIIKNTVTVATRLGVPNPKVAVLAAVELINPDMPVTLDAAALTMMNRRGQITGCIIDGPMAFDLAVSQEAVVHKGLQSEVAGCADILLFHTIEAANSTVKSMILCGNCLFGGVVVGAQAPIIMPSRSDSDSAKMFSIACAVSLTS